MGVVERITSAVRRSLQDYVRAISQMSAPAYEYAYVHVSSRPGAVWRFDSFAEAIAAINVELARLDSGYRDRIELAERPVVACVQTASIVRAVSISAGVDDNGELHVSVRYMQYFLSEIGDREVGPLRLLGQ